MKKTLRLKEKILLTIMAVALIFAYVPTDGISSLFSVQAYTPVETTISNGDFDNYSGSSYPKTATDWTKDSNNSTSSSIKAGVISTDTDVFTENQENYGLSSLPNNSSSSEDNDYVYMINGKTASTSYGINSASITLEKESFYIISVQVLTSVDIYNGDDAPLSISSFASIYLEGDDINSSFLSINTYGSWDSYRFFIETNQFESTALTIGLWLGSQNSITSAGAVLFDKITAYRYDNNEFVIRKNSSSFVDSNDKLVSLVDNTVDATSKITNPSFEDADITSWTLETNEDSSMSHVFYGRTAIGANYSSDVTQVTSNPLSNLKYNNKFALYINNMVESGITYSSPEITIERQSYYTLSIYAKTGTFDEGGATISLVPTNEDLTAVSFTSIATSTSNNSISNNWTKYTFYILGSPFGDESFHIELGVGSTDEDDLIEGYAFFDDIQMTKISYNSYTNATTDSYNKQLQLFTSGTTPNIANAYFNFADTNYEGTYPLAPASWTAENDDNTTSGIISTNQTHFNATTNPNYGNLSLDSVGFTPLQYNTDLATADNNLLMIRNAVAGYQSYTSSSYSMTANSYYRITIDIRTMTAGNAFIKIISDSTTLATYNINSNDAWQTVSLYINSGNSAKNISVTLGLGTSTAIVSGYAFFDNVRVASIESDAFDAITETSITKKINLTNENFELLLDETDGEYTKPANWSITLSETDDISIDAGVVEDANGNMLAITSALAENNVRYLSNFSTTIDSAKYYTIKFTVKTVGFGSLTESGAKIGFSEATECFENIVDTSLTEYTFYIGGSDYTTLTPYLSLISSDATDTLSVYLSNITVEEITQSTFETMVETMEEDDAPTDIVIVGTAEEDEGEETNETTSYSDTFDWLLIPSLIISIAVIMAIVGFGIKNKKFRKFKTVRKSNYDRLKSLHPEVIRREIEESRRQKLAVLEEKLRKNEEAFQDYEKAYQEKLKNLAELKMEHKQQAEFRKYARGRKKLANEQEKLIDEKEFVISTDFDETAETALLKRREREIEVESEKVVNTEATENNDISTEEPKQTPKENDINDKN